MNNLNIVGSSEILEVTGTADAFISNCNLENTAGVAIAISNAIQSLVSIKDSTIIGNGTYVITTGAGTGTATPNILLLDNSTVIQDDTGSIIGASTGGANNGDLVIQMNATLLWADSGNAVDSINVTSASSGEVYLEPLGRVTSNADIPTASNVTLVNRTFGDIDCNLDITDPRL
jgi:hypothetical protein